MLTAVPAQVLPCGHAEIQTCQPAFGKTAGGFLTWSNGGIRDFARALGACFPASLKRAQGDGRFHPAGPCATSRAARLEASISAVSAVLLVPCTSSAGCRRMLRTPSSMSAGPPVVEQQELESRHADCIEGTCACQFARILCARTAHRSMADAFRLLHLLPGGLDSL